MASPDLSVTTPETTLDCCGVAVFDDCDPVFLVSTICEPSRTKSISVFANSFVNKLATDSCLAFTDTFLLTSTLLLYMKR